MDDVESLKKAFAGAYGVYAVTNFWEHFSAEKEKVQARNIADAAKAAGVKHVIWSTLEDTRKLMPSYLRFIRGVIDAADLLPSLRAGGVPGELLALARPEAARQRVVTRLQHRGERHFAHLRSFHGGVEIGIHVVQFAVDVGQ